MIFQARNRIFSIALVAVLVAGVIEVVMLVRFAMEYTDSEASAAAVLARHREVAMADPSPTLDNLRAAEQNLEALQRRREEAWRMLGRVSPLRKRKVAWGPIHRMPIFQSSPTWRHFASWPRS